MASSISLNTTTRLTLSATAGNVTELSFPATMKSVYVQFIGAEGKIAFSGTDATAIGSNYMTVYGNQIVRFPLPIKEGKHNFGQKVKIYVASSLSSGVVEVLACE